MARDAKITVAICRGRIHCFHLGFSCLGGGATAGITIAIQPAVLVEALRKLNADVLVKVWMLLPKPLRFRKMLCQQTMLYVRTVIDFLTLRC